MNQMDDLQMVWSDFQKSRNKHMSNVRNNHNFSDVTLVGDDLELVPAHRVIISAGSDFFDTILNKTGRMHSSFSYISQILLGGQTNPLIYLRGVSKEELEVILTFLYTGETRVDRIRLDSFLALARDLGVRGFAQQDGTVITQTESESIYKDIQDIKRDTNEAVADEVTYNDISKLLNESIEELEVDQSEKLFKRNLRPSPSVVWKYAKKVESNKCQCNFCGIRYIMKGSKGYTTTSIREHLLKHHSDVPEVVMDIKSSTRLQKVYKRLKKSPVWKYSEKILIDRAKCLLCDKILWCINGTTSDIRYHLLNSHSDNQDVIKDIPSKVAKKLVKNKNEDQKKIIFDMGLIQEQNKIIHSSFKLEQTMPQHEVSYEDDTDSDENFPLSDNVKIPSIDRFRMKNFLQQINDEECVCLLCECTLENKSPLKYDHLIQQHSGHESIEPKLKQLKNFQSQKRRSHAETTDSSSIWKFFTKDQKNLYAKCNLCPYKVFEIREGVVRQFVNHLHLKHPDELSGINN